MIIAKFLQSTFTINTAQKQEVEQDQRLKELLPGNLAARILNLEIECEGEHISKELLGELVTLYTKAIQYYESINSDKYTIYKKRLQCFLAKPSIQSMLVGKDSNLTLKKEMVQRNRLHAIVNTKEEMAKIIQKSDKRTDSNKKILDNEIKTQQLNLQARISRRKSMSNKSTKMENDDCEDNWKTAILKQKMSVNFLVNDIKDRNTKRVFF